MSSKKLNVVALVGLAALLFMVFDCLTGKAGNLERNEPPQPTMVTLCRAVPGLLTGCRPEPLRRAAERFGCYYPPNYQR